MVTPNPALKDFWMTPARIRVLHGGRSSSKSWDAATIAMSHAHNATIRVLCTRQFQNKVGQSVYTLLKKQIHRYGLQDQFIIGKTSIVHKYTESEFIFSYGLSRNIDEIRSLEGIDILWIEEAHNLTPYQWEVLEPTIRNEGSEIWLIFNPLYDDDFSYRRFVANPPPYSLVRQINYDENPFLSDTILKTIEAKKAEDYEEFQHIYLGVPRDSSDGAIIKRSWINSAIDAHLSIEPASGEWLGSKIVGYDVADSGDDLNATCVMDGSVCIDIDEWKANEDELFESAKRVHRKAQNIEARMIGYDSIGVGASTGAHLNNLEFKKHFKFNAASKVVKPNVAYKDTKIKNNEFFANLKAQAWWQIADRFRNTHLAIHKGRKFNADEMISISSDCDKKLLAKLCDELATPKKDYDNAGRVKVESKNDLKKREVPSPNIADSFIIANSYGLNNTRNVRVMVI